MTSPVRSYMHEFNQNASLYQKQKSDEVENLLNRSLSLLDGIQKSEMYRPDNLESCQFFISLYGIMKKVDFESGCDLGTACLSTLQNATRNLDARQALLHQFRFIPLLAGILVDVNNKDISFQLLSTMQDLSYGIEITWQEPYLTHLIQKLIEYIYGEETSLGNLALSVLINICYKNLPSIYLLLRLIRITKFSKKIQSYGILAHKMLIILNDYINSPDGGDISKFIKKSFMDIYECFKTCNVPYLKHIVEFLTDVRNSQSMLVIFKEYNDSNSDIEKLLEQIDSKAISENVPYGDDSQKNLSLCYSLVFTLLECFIKFDLTISGAVILQIFDMAVKWIESAQASAKAMELMRTIVVKFPDEHVSKIIKSFETIFPNMLCKIEKNEITSDQTVALLKLLVVLLRHTKMQIVVLTTFSESYFDKAFLPLIRSNPEALNYADFSIDDLAKYLLCLQVLIEFSNIAPNVWHSKVVTLFGMKQIHYVIAKCVLCGNENLCQVAFEMAKTPSFPRDDVAKITSKLTPLINASNPKSNSNTYSNVIMTNENLCVNSDLEDRMDAIIESIFEAKERSELNNVATSELIHLFHYKIKLFSNTEKNLLKNLGDATEEITNLSHRINLLSHEISQYYSMNFKLHLTQERLQAENMDYIKQRDMLKETISELVKTAETNRKRTHSYISSLESKTAQIDHLHTEIETYKQKEAVINTEVKKLEAEKRETTARIDQMKKTITLLEESNKEKQKMVEINAKEHQKFVKEIEEQRDTIIKSEHLIKHMEKQLSAKNEKIRMVEAELLETEEIRRNVLSLMESKRPKRPS